MAGPVNKLHWCTIHQQECRKASCLGNDICMDDYKGVKPSKPPLHIINTIPSECEQYKDDIRRFMDAMFYKLKLNAHKGRWENRSLADALKLLEGEVAELKEAIADGNRVEIELEAADVANFAMIVAAIAIERGK